MRLHRFFIDKHLTVGDIRLIDSELINQWKNVLKLAVGDRVVLIEEGVAEGEAVINLVTKKEVVVSVENINKTQRQDREVTLYCAILKKDNFELVCQKATEIGITSIVPVVTNRTVKLALNQDRLNKIVKEASEQSGRMSIPKISEMINFDDLLKKSLDGQKIILNMSGDKKISPREDKINILIGPEGGFTEEEVAKAEQSDWQTLSLGENTYRAETAAIVATYLAVEKFI